MNYKLEFPHFDDVLEFPQGWTDSSWHNDICPSFELTIEGGVYKVFCDFKNPELREVGGRQFTVCYSPLIDDELEFQAIQEFDTLQQALTFIERVTA